MELLESIDQGAIYPFRFVSFKVPQSVPLINGLAYLGHLYVLLAVLLLGIVLLLLKRSPRAAALLTLTALASFAVTHAGKAAVDRDWPNVRWSDRAIEPTELKSFPSGHALMSTALYASLGILLARRVSGHGLRGVLLGLGFALPFLAGVARLCLGHHYLTDVLAGWVAGAVLVFICTDWGNDQTPMTNDQ